MTFGGGCKSEIYKPSKLRFETVYPPDVTRQYLEGLYNSIPEECCVKTCQRQVEKDNSESSFGGYE
jgi:hypothetical protein